MFEGLFATKLPSPKYRPNVISRFALTEKLSEGLSKKFTLVSAPAGYGKSTIIENWVLDLGRPLSWLSLDKEDNDPYQFFTYLVAALGKIKNEFGQSIEVALTTSARPEMKELVVKFLQELAVFKEPSVFVLDDYHVIEERQIHEIIGDFINRMPPAMHLVLISREDPPLPLAKLRVRGEISEIRASDLEFTRGESETFLNEIMGLDLSIEEIAMLEARTEGWIAGLVLAAHSLRSTSDRWAFLREFAGDDRQVMDYLSDEAMANLPEEVQEFLLKTSLLDQLNAELCQTVVYGEGSVERSQSLLEYMERANLFTIPLDQQRRWYRYHHLFKEMLESYLRLRLPEKIVEIHARASRWYEKEGQLTLALRHIRASGDQEREISVVERHGIAALSRGEGRNVLRWLDNMPIEVVRNRPFLCVLYAWAQWLSNYSDPPPTIHYWLEDAERGMSSSLEILDSEDNVMGDRLKGYIAALRVGIALFQANDPPQIINMANEALEQVHEEDVWLLSMLHHILTMHYLIKDEVQAAIRSDEKAFRYAKISEFDYLSIGIFYDRAAIALRQAKTGEAEAICVEGLQAAIKPNRRVSPISGVIQTLRGRIMLERNELEAAEKMLNKGLDLLSLTSDQELRELARGELARLYQARGEWSRAEEIIGQIEPFSDWVSSFTSALQALLWLRESEQYPRSMIKAVQWANEHREGLGDTDEIPAVLPIFEMKYAVMVILVRVLIGHAREMSNASRKRTIQSLLELLDVQMTISDRTGWMERLMELAILKAMAHDALGESESALKAIQQALKIGEPERYVRIFVDEGPAMGRLLHELASREIFTEYVGHLLAAFPDAKPVRETPLKTSDLGYEVVEPLSDRELEVLNLIAEGLSNREIAQRLYLSPNTVKGHSRNIFGKLGVNNRTQASTRARRMGLLSST
jgi:LuxR family maltose regulon positive regulatory protein